jgi:aminoglycoside phosphotransferase (APT) family kinase protein
VQAVTETHPALCAWVQEHCGLELTQAPQRLSGGNANVTERLVHREGAIILRRPPDAAISESAASGIRREFAMLSALAGHAPVPKPIGFCDDTAIIGQAFALVECVDGVAITQTLPAAYAESSQSLQRMGEQLIDGLASVHKVDWEAVGIRRPRNDPQTYLATQIQRWHDRRQEVGVRALPAVAPLAAWLVKHMPAQQPVAVLHGDFHLDNTLFDTAQPQLAAIIDWELATVGNPLSDVGLCLAFWGPRAVEPPGFAFVQGVTRPDPGISREQLAARWSEQTGIDSSALDYYRVFALWRLACIVEDAFVLYSQGKVDSSYARGLAYDVPAMLHEAATIAGLSQADHA